MAAARRSLAAALLGGALAAATVAAPAPAAAGPLENMVRGQLEGLLSTNGIEARIGNLDGLFGTVVIEDVVLTDEQGEFLRIPRGVLDWRPGALVRGRLRVEGLRLENPELLRLPITQPTPEEDPPQEGGGLDLGMLSRLSVEQMTVENLQLGEAVLGEAMRLTLTGLLLPTDGGGIRTDLTLDRLDGAGGKAQLAAALSPGQELELDLQAAEPAGGILARLLDLPGQPPVQVALEGAGPASSWQGELSAVAEGLAEVAGDVTLAYPEDGRWSVATDLLATTGAAAPDTWRELTRDGLTLQVAAASRDDGVVVDSLTAATDAYVVTASGLAMAPDGALAGEATLRTDDARALDALVALPFAAGSATVRLDGTLSQPQALVEATLTGVDTGQGLVDRLTTRLDLAAGGPLTDPASPLTARGAATLTGLPVVVPGDSAEVALDATLVRETGALDIRLLQIETPLLTAEAELAANITDLTAAGTITARAAEVAPLAELAGLPLAAGEGRLDVRLDSAGAGGAVAGRVDLTLTGLAWTDPLYAEALGERLAVAADLRRDDAGAIRVSDLSVQSAGVSGTGEAVVAAELDRLTADVTLDIPDLAIAAPTVRGPARVRLQAEGAPAAPDLTVTATSPALDAAGTPLRDVRLDLTARGLSGDGTAGTVSFAAIGPRGAPLRLRTPYEAPGFTRLRLPQVALQAAGLDLGGALDIGLDPLAVDGRLRGSVTDWGALSAVAGTALAGEGGAVDLRLTPAGGGQRAVAVITAEALRLPDSGAAAQAVRLEATLGALFTAPTVTAALRTGPGEAGGMAWTSAAADLSGTAERGDVTLEMAGATGMTAAARYDLPAQRLVLTDFAAVNEAQDLRLDLVQPATLSYGRGLGIADLRLTVNRQGRIDLDADLGPQRVAIELTVADLPLQLAQDVTAGPPVTGLLEARVSIAGPPSNPRGTVYAAVPDLDIPDAAVDDLALRLTGDLAGGRLEMQMGLEGVQADELTGTASIPVAFSAQGIPSIPETQPLQALVRWRGQVETLWQLVPLVGHRLYGTGAGVVGVEGTLADPQLTADVRISNGRYENLEYGTVLTDLTVEASRQPDGAVGVVLTARDGGDGTLRLDARTRLDEGGTLVIAANGDLRSATVVRRDDLVVALSGPLGFDGPLDGGGLTADLTVEYALLRLVNSLGGGVRTLPVVEVGGDPALLARRQAEEAAPPVFNVGLDIRVSAPNRLYVRGRGLDSEWAGTVRVSGTSQRPNVVGQIQVVRGRFDLVGNTFVFTEGLVELTGGGAVDPSFDITAENETRDGMTAVIHVSGTASRPELELTSRPPLPEDEVMARVLFGRSLSDLGPVEALQAANAVRVLTGLGGEGPGIMDVMRDTLGVDTIRLGGGADGPAVEIGKYITEDVYVGVEQGAGIDSGGVNVEVKLTPSIKLEGRTTGRGSDVGVNWERDY
ncbi:translocation/assembly module TamB domain-containing protein [Caenispirillum bisanense]|uniref:translocation/assembly module TamB domain-containing protein n=1 Tax=Caenispirillum bisanense TaxID=414052 RepID=UPI0031DB82CD